MKKIFPGLLLSLFMACNALAGTTAVTPDGKTVVLHDNGTWEYRTESADFTVSQHKTAEVVGDSTGYTFRYDPGQWVLLQQDLNPMAEYSFVSADQKLYAVIISEPLKLSPELTQMAALENVQKADKSATLRGFTEVTLNGRKAYRYVIDANIADTSFFYLYHVVIGDHSTTQIINFSTADNLEKNAERMRDFASGFSLR